MNNIKIFTLTLLVLMASTLKAIEKKPISKTVRLSGTLLNFGNNATLERNDLIGSLAEDSRKIALDENGQFEINFELEKPSYFRIGRNHLYLSPGDNLEMDLDLMDPEKGIFKGNKRVVEMNMFLRKNPFPKGGSYAGSFYRKPHHFDDAPYMIYQYGEEDIQRLERLENVTPEFREMERARIDYHRANSLLSYSFYGKPDSVKTREQHAAFSDFVNKRFISHIRGYLKGYNNEAHINLPVYRDLLYNLIGNDLYKKLSLTPPKDHLIEYIQLNTFLSELSSKGLSAEILKKKDGYLANFKEDLFRGVIQRSVKKYENLLPGKPATDFSSYDLKGKEVLISSFKEKLIVVDIWATWCGPCLQQMPSFEALKEKYKDKKIAFISLSIDRDEKLWKNFVESKGKKGYQLLTSRSNLGSYLVKGIPRYLVITRKMEIIDVFAPDPASGELEKLIQKYI